MLGQSFREDMRCFQSFLGVLKLVSPNDSRLATLEISLSTLDSRLLLHLVLNTLQVYYDVSDHSAVYMKLNLYFFAKGGLFDMKLKRYDFTRGAGILG